MAHLEKECCVLEVEEGLVRVLELEEALAPFAP
jgi:hypothetical protein